MPCLKVVHDIYIVGTENHFVE